MGKNGNGEGSIYKRKSDGQWVAALIEPTTGRRRVAYGKTRAEAFGKLQRAQRNLADNLPVAPERITVGQYLQGWLVSSAKLTLRPRTWEDYARIVDQHLTPAIGHSQLGRLLPQHVQDLIARKAEQG